MSTHTAGIPIAYDLTHAAVFLPTIGSVIRTSVSSGTMQSYSSLSTLQQSTMAFAFCFGNPAGLTSMATSSASASAISSIELYFLKRLSDAFRVLSSLVLWDSIVAIRTWKGSGSHSGFRPSDDLPGYAPLLYSFESTSKIHVMSFLTNPMPPLLCGMTLLSVSYCRILILRPFP